MATSKPRLYSKKWLLVNPKSWARLCTRLLGDKTARTSVDSRSVALIFNLLNSKNMSTMRSLSIQFGLLMLAGFIAIFYAIYMLGYAQHTELRVLNAVVHLSCMYFAIRAYYKSDRENVQNYMLGVAQGMEASVIGVVGYALFIVIFMKIDPRLMNLITRNSPMAIYLNPYTITLGILTEGLMVSLIGSYLLTRFYGYTLKAV
jgi:hypothetical protein